MDDGKRNMMKKWHHKMRKYRMGFSKQTGLVWRAKVTHNIFIFSVLEYD